MTWKWIPSSEEENSEDIVEREKRRHFSRLGAVVSMGQYQVTAMLRDEEELERFALGQRLARDEEKRVTWERHYREAKKELEELQTEIERLKEEKTELEKTVQSLRIEKSPSGDTGVSGVYRQKDEQILEDRVEK